MNGKKYSVVPRPVTMTVPKGWKKTKCREDWCQFDLGEKSKVADRKEKMFVVFGTKSIPAGLKHDALKAKLHEDRRLNFGTQQLAQIKKEVKNGAMAVWIQGRLEQYGQINVGSFHRPNKVDTVLKKEVVTCWARYKWSSKISSAETDRISKLLQQICTGTNW